MIITRALALLLVSPCLYVTSASAVTIFEMTGVAFVDQDGRSYAPATEHRLRIDYASGEYRLSGFGLKAELVKPYFTIAWRPTRRLIFRAVDPKSTARPDLILDRDGWAHLRTKRLRKADLNLAGRHRLEPGFRRQSFDTNLLRIPLTFRNPVARAWRACAWALGRPGRFLR